MHVSKKTSRTVGTGLALIAAGLISGPPMPARASSTPTQHRSFAFTGGEQVFVVPAGVHAVRIAAVGAHGGDVVKDADPGGLAGTAVGTVRVTPGERLYVEVGGAPAVGEGSPGGFNGGGQGNAGADADHSGAGGGGASDVRTQPRSAAGTLASRLVVAAGGGGGHQGGNGGAADGGAGDDSDSHFGGYGATLSAGGAGGQGAGNIDQDGGSGGLGLGGTGALGGGTEDTVQYGGGGGGGGYYGGGGGTNGDGGGGGSDYVVASATAARVGTDLADAPAHVTISYSLPQHLSLAPIHIQRVRSLVRHGVKVHATCRLGCRLDLELTVSAKQARTLGLGRHHGRVRIGETHAHLRAGTHAVVRVRLSAHARRVLKKAHHWSMRLTATPHPGGGASAVHRTVRVRR